MSFDGENRELQRLSMYNAAVFVIAIFSIDSACEFDDGDGDHRLLGPIRNPSPDRKRVCLDYSNSGTTDWRHSGSEHFLDGTHLW